VVVHTVGRRYDVVHAPTGLSLHFLLQDLTKDQALVAIEIARHLCDWDWSDGDLIHDMPWSQKRDIWDALETISAMSRA
jgi:hypothetical protein